MKKKNNTIETILILIGWAAAFAATVYLAFSERKDYEDKNMNEENAKLYPCPCCGQLTLHEGKHGSFEICPVCKWEDDRVQWKNPDEAGGANKVSLNEARENFKKYGNINGKE